LVLQLDLLRHRHAVLGDGGRAERLLDDDVAALGAERHLDCISERVDALEDRLTGAHVEKNFLGHVCQSPYFSITPRMSSSRIMRCSCPSILISVPAYLENRTRSPALMSSARTLPSSRILPFPTAITSPSMGFSLAVSGMMIPPFVFSSSCTRLTITRSCKGLIFMDFPLLGALRRWLALDTGECQGGRNVTAPGRVSRGSWTCGQAHCRYYFEAREG